VARSDVDVVVTEHGVADLREVDLDTRRALLIAIADPAFRDDLMRAAQ
jgi:acetyl-CoA hydrolase